ncbi:MAG: hypothetical protein KGJ45_11465 [Elusimicrobia bacterium]|nr:hypothetical protein [Elusimicrobiota bacterium]
MEHLHLSIEHVAVLGTSIALFYWLMRLLMAWLALHSPGPLANIFTAVGAFFPGAGGQG